MRTIPLLSPEQVEQFWSKVDRTGPCWLWNAHKDGRGYGSFAVQGITYKAHRVAWTIVNGPIPEGMILCHDCPGGDNPACVNPAHIFLGDARANAQDAMKKGRTRLPSADQKRKGETHPVSKLTNQDVIEIRRLYAEGNRQDAIASKFSVRKGTIHAIIYGITWKHLLSPEEPLVALEPGRNKQAKKLTWEAVREIRRRRANGETATSLGHAFGVHPTTIREIVREILWVD